VAFLISAGCSDSDQTSTSNKEIRVITGTVKDVRFFPDGYVNEPTYQIIFEDGNWIVIEETSPSYFSDGADAIIGDGLKLRTLKIGGTYIITLQKYDYSSIWEVTNIEKV